jgi:hypothetical protein
MQATVKQQARPESHMRPSTASLRSSSWIFQFFRDFLPPPPASVSCLSASPTCSGCSRLPRARNIHRFSTGKCAQIFYNGARTLIVYTILYNGLVILSAFLLPFGGFVFGAPPHNHHLAPSSRSSTCGEARSRALHVHAHFASVVPCEWPIWRDWRLASSKAVRRSSWPRRHCMVGSFAAAFHVHEKFYVPEASVSGLYDSCQLCQLMISRQKE